MNTGFAKSLDTASSGEPGHHKMLIVAWLTPKGASNQCTLSTLGCGTPNPANDNNLRQLATALKIVL